MRVCARVYCVGTLIRACLARMCVCAEVELYSYDAAPPPPPPLPNYGHAPHRPRVVAQSARLPVLRRLLAAAPAAGRTGFVVKAIFQPADRPAAILQF